MKFKNFLILCVILVQVPYLTSSTLKGVKRPPIQLHVNVKQEEVPILTGSSSSLSSDYPGPGMKACRCTPREYCPDPGQPIPPGVWSPRGPMNLTQADRSGSRSSSYFQSPMIPGGDGKGTRIVNRQRIGKFQPPKDGGCQIGEIYCCTTGQPGQTWPPPLYPDDHGQPGQFNPGGCGTRKQIRINGWNPEHGQSFFGNWPWLTVLVGPNNQFIGAGALLDNYHVLTAAHKVQNYLNGGFKVRFGEWNALNEEEPYKHIQVEVARVEIHPNFNPTNLHNDVAVLRLLHPVSLTAFPHINSVCLPNSASSHVGSRCWVAGYGKDDFKEHGKYPHILREVDVPVVDQGECELRLRRTGLGNQYQLNRQSFLCAGGEDGKDACTGDGGSPLVCQGSDGRFHVIGLVAWGVRCADYEVPGVYVNVGHYVHWIQSKLGEFTGTSGGPSYIPLFP